MRRVGIASNTPLCHALRLLFVVTALGWVCTVVMLSRRPTGGALGYGLSEFRRSAMRHRLPSDEESWTRTKSPVQQSVNGQGALQCHPGVNDTAWQDPLSCFSTFGPRALDNMYNLLTSARPQDWSVDGSLPPGSVSRVRLSDMDESEVFCRWGHMKNAWDSGAPPSGCRLRNVCYHRGRLFTPYSLEPGNSAAFSMVVTHMKSTPCVLRVDGWCRPLASFPAVRFVGVPVVVEVLREHNIFFQFMSLLGVQQTVDEFLPAGSPFIHAFLTWSLEGNAQQDFGTFRSRQQWHPQHQLPYLMADFRDEPTCFRTMVIGRTRSYGVLTSLMGRHLAARPSNAHAGGISHAEEHRLLLELVPRVVRRLTDGQGPVPVDEGSVLLLRRGKKDTRRMLNLAEVKRAMEDKGYRVTVAEFGNIPREEQIYLTRRHQFFVAMHGAGVANTVFVNATHGGVLELHTFGFQKWTYEGLTRYAGVPYVYWVNKNEANTAPNQSGDPRVKKAAVRGSPDELRHRDQIVNLREFKVAFDELVAKVQAHIQAGAAPPTQPPAAAD